jgi:amino acid adenylation domain-containing protein
VDVTASRDVDGSTSASPLLTAAERQQVLLDWNNTAVVYPGQDLCLHQLIEAQAERTPDPTALVFERQRLAYRELNDRANQLAHHLRDLGVGAEMVVGLLVERSLEMIVGLLGILKAGAAYMPMDTAFPQERIAFMLTDANVTILLTQSSLLASLPAGTSQVVCLDSFDWTHSERSAPSDARVRPENLAYVIYTSGSTGRPKGVCIEHRNIVNYVLGVADRLQVKPGMNHATVSTIAADLGNTVIFPALITGGCLHIISQERAENQRMLSEYFTRENINILKIVPSHLAALQTGNNPEQVMPRNRLIVGGEASRLDWIERLRFLSPNCEIYNHYGPTETTVGVLTYHVGAQLPSTLSGTLPLGRPLPNSHVYILDEHRQPVPVGVPGELCIGGRGVARGYLNRPDLTAEKFIRDPFGPDPGGRLYCTGDRARYLPDGNIEFCGRIDHQVKIRGYRVELGEIEGALREYRGVREAVVTAYEDEPGNEQLVGYVVPREGESPTAEALRHFLRQKLPKYMVPDHFVFLDSIPLTPNGKIDREALPPPSYENVSTAKESAPPGTETEKALAAIWSRLLKVDRIGIHDDFFELGGHSLMAIKVVSQIRDIFGVDLPLAKLLEAPTIADLAGILHKEHREPSSTSLVPMRPSGSKPPVFLVHAHGGNVLEYHPLVSRLDHDQPVYAFQAKGLDGHIEKDTSLERMASAYLDELKRFQPLGPYFLGGFCLGGWLALEMAQQLTAAGQQVALVVLIQSIHPDGRRFKPGTSMFHRLWCRAATQIGYELENLSHRGKGYIWERCQRAWDITRARIAIGFNNLTHNYPNDLSRLPKLFIFEAVGIEHKKAMNKYVPRPYGGDVVLFRASKQIPGLIADEYLGWRRVLHGNLDVCEAPGYQQTLLLEPNVSRLAQEFDSRLKAAQQRSSEETRESTTHQNAPGAMFPL